jgi:hypothetical protein
MGASAGASILLDVVVSAAIGAGMAKVEGGNVGKGAMTGALIGGVTGGVGAALGGPLSATGVGVGSDADVLAQAGDAGQAGSIGVSSLGSSVGTSAGLNAGVNWADTDPMADPWGYSSGIGGTATGATTTALDSAGNVIPSTLMNTAPTISGPAAPGMSLGKMAQLGLTGLSVGTGVSNAMTMRDLARSQIQQQNQANTQRQIYQQQLSQLMANPQSVTQQPGYQFGLDTGLESVKRSLAASGQGPASGATELELQKYGTLYGQNYLQQQEQNLIGLASGGFGTTPLNAGSVAGSDLNSNLMMMSTLAQLGLGGKQMGLFGS